MAGYNLPSAAVNHPPSPSPASSATPQDDLAAEPGGSGFHDLPADVLATVAALLRPPDLCAALRTCRHWRAVLTSPAHVPRLTYDPLFELDAPPPRQLTVWRRRLRALATLLPGLLELHLYVSKRVPPLALAAHLSALSETVPRLTKLELRHVGNSPWDAPARLVLPVLGSFRALRVLYVVLGQRPVTADLRAVARGCQVREMNEFLLCL